MRRKIKIIFAAGFVLMILCMSFASAASSEDMSDYFIPQYVDPQDLGDERVPLPLLCGFAGIVAAGTIIVHRKRCLKR